MGIAAVANWWWMKPPDTGGLDDDWESALQPSGFSADASWDSHACLNVLNRLAASIPATQQTLVYALAEHLKCYAILLKRRGWCSNDELRDWISSWLGLHDALHAATGQAEIHLKLPQGVGSLEVAPIGSILAKQLRSGVLVESLELTLMPARARILRASPWLSDGLGRVSLEGTLVLRVRQQAGPLEAREFALKCVGGG